ncbi:hypothetical protein PAECIP112173_03855 [Paenibacillus sp. JJ-100]|uniref:hypothetical protein n=1 Tax=Paenibacillus sp. JJ-100 TaxID=2974896 RepID=UPI0022FF8389|nr:hypothetical protein [Paenibacillus sp. JJ-100]CAI6083263.1 hypothetical protein PAECIP112173_03855 [Paenibacillus sp. JJ-100]
MGVPAVSRSFDRWLSPDDFGFSLHRETSGDKRERFASTESISPPPLRATPWDRLLKRASAFHGSRGKTSREGAAVGVPAVSRSFDRWLSSDRFGFSLHRETSDDKRERFASTESISPPPLRAAPWGHASKTRLGFHWSRWKR